MPTVGPKKRDTKSASCRSPGAVTGLYYALKKQGIKIHYVQTISTADPEVQRSAQTVREELASQVDYEDIFIEDVVEFKNETHVIRFKRELVDLFLRARSNGDALAIGVTGGRTLMGALLTQVAQMEAPANSAFYQLSVPASLEEAGQYPNFANQTETEKKKLLNPVESVPDGCHLLEISFSHFYDDVYEEL